ncbi:MAG: hypothetical protein H6672_04900 [Anaerolineaceae bacterium]|nr:hypothetical protein [Anaerolineaceae bacterium]
MDTKTTRNLVVLIAVVALVVIGLSVLSSLLTSVVPVVITALVAFVLGRMSANVGLRDVIQRLRKPASKPAEASAQKPAKAKARTPESAVQTPPKQAEKPVQPATEAETDEDIDFKVKTVGDVLAESRRLEDEVAKRNTAYDPTAAIEERRRRLLGDQSGDQ